MICSFLNGYLCHLIDIRAFISVNESATLAEFIDTNLKSFEDHQFDSIETMLRHLKGAFEKAFLAIYPNATNVRSNIAMGQVKKAFYYKEVFQPNFYST